MSRIGNGPENIPREVVIQSTGLALTDPRPVRMVFTCSALEARAIVTEREKIQAILQQQTGWLIALLLASGGDVVLPPERQREAAERMAAGPLYVAHNGAGELRLSLAPIPEAEANAGIEQAAP
jgi:hypothetical protein